jgi:hypothetical protein
MPAFLRPILWTVAAMLLWSTVVSTGSLARPDAASEDEITGDFDFWSSREGAKFAKYYRAHARISAESAAEPERSLANGVRWRLLVDEGTGMRMPRITWMSNRQSMAAANDFLEKAHGAAIAQADVFNRIWLGNNTIRRDVRGLPPYSPLPLQSDVELTYATSRFVNYIDLGTRETRERDFSGRGDVRIFDIRTGAVYSFSLCPVRYGWDGHGHEFTIPINSVPPFAVCSDAAYDAYRVVVMRWASLAIPAGERDRQPVDGCSRTAHQLARWGRGGVDYLTPTGVATILNDSWPTGRPTNCRLSAGDPVIVPYRELKRFMRRGPFSDELLKPN